MPTSCSTRRLNLICLNGIRAISMLWIVYLHCYEAFYYTYDLYNPDYFSRFQRTFARTFLKNGELAVDTFFVITGMLVMLNFVKARERKKPFNIFKFYIHRYLRVVPVFLSVVLFMVAFSEHTVSGPKKIIWTGEFYTANCKKYWWSALLLVQNYFNPLNVVGIRKIRTYLFLTFLFSVSRSQLVYFG